MRVLSLAVLALVCAPFAALGAETTATYGTLPGVDATGTVLAAPGGYIMGPGAELHAAKYALEIGAELLSYEYSESGYQEWGSGSLLNMRGRFYAQSERADRLWVAAGVAAGTVEVEWREHRYGGGWDNGTERSSVVVPNFGVGYKFLLAEDRLTVDPQFLAGIVGGSDSDSPFIVGAGIGVGLRF